MKKVTQTLDDITSKLKRLDSQWEDDFGLAVINELSFLKKELDSGKPLDSHLIQLLLEKNFKIYMTIFRLFFSLSKDGLESYLLKELNGKIGITAFKENPKPFVDFFVNRGLPNIAISYQAKKWTWEDIITERLKLMRGRAVKGQKRGRSTEDAVENVIKKVFGNKYDIRCNFTGLYGQEAKAEFAIPNKNNPSIIFEAKAYDATGSKQTDVLGDIAKVINVKKPVTDFLFVTDGITWLQRLSDLRKIVEFQNNGDIRKIYTLSMLIELEDDLKDLKNYHGI
ncbi:MAG: hypothetical protein K9L30_15805 [Desulfobacterales bacterium]|nr:hypothetical protein [Desulfobacterales bacterium]